MGSEEAGEGESGWEETVPTVMIKICSTLGTKSKTTSTGVPGLTATPAFIPAAWILSMRAGASSVFFWVHVEIPDSLANIQGFEKRTGGLNMETI